MRYLVIIMWLAFVFQFTFVVTAFAVDLFNVRACLTDTSMRVYVYGH